MGEDVSWRGSVRAWGGHLRAHGGPYHEGYGACATGAALAEADGADIVLVIADVFEFPALSNHWRGHQI